MGQLEICVSFHIPPVIKSRGVEKVGLVKLKIKCYYKIKIALPELLTGESVKQDSKSLSLVTKS